MLSEILRAGKLSFHPVVPFDPEQDKLVAVDMTAANPSLSLERMRDIDGFCQYFVNLLQEQGARYAIGGYAEHRTVYANSPVFDGQENTEPRRFHLGTDIWGSAGTAVMAPLDGSVHSFGINGRDGDYGGTIILQHNLGEAIFYTLYGHLSHASVEQLQKGKLIRKGETFAWLGTPSENGHWPPHLHFQLIGHIGDWNGDYPGVCAYSERDKWLQNSPDPDLLLQLNRYIRE